MFSSIHWDIFFKNVIPRNILIISIFIYTEAGARRSLLQQMTMPRPTPSKGEKEKKKVTCKETMRPPELFEGGEVSPIREDLDTSSKPSTSFLSQNWNDANIFDIVDPTQEHQQEKNPDSLSASTPMKSVSKDVEEVPAIQIKKKSTTKRPPEADWKIHYNDVKQRMTKMEDKVDKLVKNQAILISMLRSESQIKANACNRLKDWPSS